MNDENLPFRAYVSTNFIPGYAKISPSTHYSPRTFPERTSKTKNINTEFAKNHKHKRQSSEKPKHIKLIYIKLFTKNPQICFLSFIFSSRVHDRRSLYILYIRFFFVQMTFINVLKYL